MSAITAITATTATTPPAPSAPPWLTLTGARLRNLKNIDLHLPLGRLVMVAGPSGAGKSTLFRDLLHPAVAQAIKTDARKLTGRQFVRAGGISLNAEWRMQNDEGPAPTSGTARTSRPHG
ncbi:MAG: ATP-binding cassette domain-containing protein, partial [Opitutaceae bacterium]|nr:ATP-binding cassette domain-containing protein [Opitutaceae bacterium]